MIPKPFARLTFVYGDPTYVNASDSRGAAMQGEAFEASLNEVVAAAQALDQERR